MIRSMKVTFLDFNTFCFYTSQKDIYDERIVNSIEDFVCEWIITLQTRHDGFKFIWMALIFKQPLPIHLNHHSEISYYFFLSSIPKICWKISLFMV